MKPELLLADFARALAALEAALATPPGDDVRRAGCIQYFEFCFELAWKSVKVTAEHSGLKDVQSPRNCLRQAYRQGWLQDESAWLRMLEARNLMAHTYDARRALSVYDELPGFATALRSLLGALEKQLGA